MYILPTLSGHPILALFVSAVKILAKPPASMFKLCGCSNSMISAERLFSSHLDRLEVRGPVPGFVQRMLCSGPI